jgi:hypothetical protein
VNGRVLLRADVPRTPFVDAAGAVEAAGDFAAAGEVADAGELAFEEAFGADECCAAFTLPAVTGDVFKVLGAVEWLVTELLVAELFSDELLTVELQTPLAGMAWLFGQGQTH